MWAVMRYVTKKVPYVYGLMYTGKDIQEVRPKDYKKMMDLSKKISKEHFMRCLHPWSLEQMDTAGKTFYGSMVYGSPCKFTVLQIHDETMIEVYPLTRYN